jgi:glycogen debranching enzyme
MESLFLLAAYQGRTYCDETEEEPGKILHELRFGETARAKEVPCSPYYGSVDATPLFVLVADAFLKITGDLDTARALESAVLAALQWMDERTHRGTAFLTYQRKSVRGLDNQGWKDSRAGVSHPDGRCAVPPVALCEVQGYCVDAYRRGARFVGALGHLELANEYEIRADRLASLFESEFWLPKVGRYAFAIDGNGEKLETVVSNLGHLLWSRLPIPSRARAVATLLTEEASFTGFGIRTLASGQPVYNPFGYHTGAVWPHDNALIVKGMANYGFGAHVARVFEGLVCALDQLRGRRLPQLFCGLGRADGGPMAHPIACSPQAWAAAAPFLLLQAALGIHLDGRGGGLLIRNPSLPPSVGRLDIDGLRVGNATVSLGFRREGQRCHVDRAEITGGELRTEIALDLTENQGT